MKSSGINASSIHQVPLIRRLHQLTATWVYSTRGKTRSWTTTERHWQWHQKPLPLVTVWPAPMPVVRSGPKRHKSLRRLFHTAKEPKKRRCKLCSRYTGWLWKKSRLTTHKE
eukprot:Lithocolla_globosa_v1_NODE_4113_length_1508_cov_5.434274.p2 type:complete len:112 gc:universal NODE_4113_length_1508_cov_5.434274:639-304(-)